MFFIRQANPEDSIDIANIHFRSWQATYSELLPTSYVANQNILFGKKKMWQEVIAHPNVIVWIAFDADLNPVGFIGYFTKGNCYEITTLYVLPNQQGLGIGTKLMNVSLQTILASHINASFYLWVLATNTAAILFYKKFGFVCNGERNQEHYKSIQIIDIKMVKNVDTLTT